MVVHSEAAFELAIESHLHEHGWVKGTPSHFNRVVGLDTAVLFEFIGATQPKQWGKLVGLHGGPDQAQSRFLKRLTAELDTRGTIDVLRRGVDDLGQRIRLAYFKPAHAITPELGVLYEANRLVVTRQVHHSESNPHDSVDVLLSVNGLPVATAELKNPLTGQSVEQAKHQYRYDRNPRDLIFARRTIAHFAVDPDLVFMTTRLTGPTTSFLPFNEGTGGPGREGGAGNPPTSVGYRTAYLWERVWQRDNWLDLLYRFVHQDRTAGKSKSNPAARTIFPRFHQWDLVLRLSEHARSYGPGHNYLVQHSAGSGKSNSIAWLAHRLSTLHTPPTTAELTEHAVRMGLGPNDKVFSKVIVVTDRVVLDRQLQTTIAQFDHTPGVVERVDRDSKQLADALAGSRAQVIITTLQKFPVIAKSAADLTGSRFAVIVDEAHSSQSGESAKDLKDVLSGTRTVQGSGATVDDAIWDAAEKYDSELEAAADPEDALAEGLDLLRRSAALRGMQDNLSFFAFTATPKNKTLALFGEHVPDPAEEQGYRLEPFHLYSMRQAIEEGFILDVLANYVTYSTYFRLANGLTSDDPELEKGRATAALARFVSLHPSNLAQKSEIIVEHFRAHTARQIGGQAKAMIVTRSRLHAVRYKESVEAYISEKHYPHLHALVAFSGTVEDPDAPGLNHTESSMNLDRAGRPIPESETAARFKGDQPFGVGDYQVLIVAEKYQTGFDEPRLQTMYVDKKLDGVRAVQTLSRLNRTMPGKDSTFVLDFQNKAEDIKAAFKPFFETSWTVPTDPNVLSNLRQRILRHQVIDNVEMRGFVAAVLGTEKAAHAALYGQTDAAVVRFEAMDTDDREDFRTGLRDFVRAFAFLGQVVPYQSTDFEELFYYGKFLLLRLARDRDPGGFDLGDAAVLTHIRTQLQGEHDLALDPGEGEPVTGLVGEGRGRDTEPPRARLSEIIGLLNDKFGTELKEADQIWFDQQVEAAVANTELREFAADNTEENFGYVFDGVFSNIVIDRQDGNDELFRMFFDKPEFKNALTKWARREVYRRINVPDRGTNTAGQPNAGSMGYRDAPENEDWIKAGTWDMRNPDRSPVTTMLSYAHITGHSDLKQAAQSFLSTVAAKAAPPQLVSEARNLAVGPPRPMPAWKQFNGDGTLVTSLANYAERQGWTLQFAAKKILAMGPEFGVPDSLRKDAKAEVQATVIPPPPNPGAPGPRAN
jgi:type I restriction enzyme R subunit